MDFIQMPTPSLPPGPQNQSRDWNPFGGVPVNDGSSGASPAPIEYAGPDSSPDTYFPPQPGGFGMFPGSPSVSYPPPTIPMPQPPFNTTEPSGAPRLHVPKPPVVREMQDDGDPIHPRPSRSSTPVPGPTEVPSTVRTIRNIYHIKADHLELQEGNNYSVRNESIDATYEVRGEGVMDLGYGCIVRQ